jgi:hypothetical protein
MTKGDARNDKGIKTQAAIERYFLKKQTKINVPTLKIFSPVNKKITQDT